MSSLRWLVRRAPTLALLLAVSALFLGVCHGGHDFVPHGGTVVAPAGYHHGCGGAGSGEQALSWAGGYFSGCTSTTRAGPTSGGRTLLIALGVRRG